MHGQGAEQDPQRVAVVKGEVGADTAAGQHLCDPTVLSQQKGPAAPGETASGELVTKGCKMLFSQPGQGRQAWEVYLVFSPPLAPLNSALVAVRVTVLVAVMV